MKLQTVSNKKRQEALIANLKSKNPEWVPAENYALDAQIALPVEGAGHFSALLAIFLNPETVSDSALEIFLCGNEQCPSGEGPLCSLLIADVEPLLDFYEPEHEYSSWLDRVIQCVRYVLLDAVSGVRSEEAFIELLSQARPFKNVTLARAF